MFRTKFPLAAAALLAMAAPSPAQGSQNTSTMLFQVSQRGDMPYVEQYSWLTAGDFDLDGDLDLFLASPYMPNRFLRNNGKGTFTDWPSNGIPATEGDIPDGGVQAGDVDGDGDLDLLISHGDWNATDAEVDLYINDGKGNFVDQSSWRLPKSQARTVTFIDVDNDKDLDIILGRTGKQNLLWINDGNGRFFDDTPASMPVDTNMPFSVDVGDVDGDGDLDFVVGTWSQSKPHEALDILYLNGGTGGFTNGPIHSDALATRGAKLIDVDFDGDLDYIAAVGDHYNPDRDVLFLNDGKGVFMRNDENLLPTVVAGSRRYVSGDFDGNGTDDLYLPGTTGRLLLHEDDGGFVDKTATNLPHDPNRNRSAVVGDMDNDGDLDLVVTSGNQVRLLINDRTGKFTSQIDSWFPFSQACAESVAMGDIDGDGDLDIIVASYPIYPTTTWNNKVYINDGRGRFTEESGQRLVEDSLPSTCVAVFDADGDGDLDIVFGNEGAPASLFLNNGQGHFEDATLEKMPQRSPLTYGIRAADLDNDGDMDLILANWGDDSLYINDGHGYFLDESARFPSEGSGRAVAIGDLDGDSDLDVVIGNGFFDTDSNGKVILRPNRILLNNGHATFEEAPPSYWPQDGADETLDLAIGDVDGDGDLDLYESTGILSDRYDNLYLNNGKGMFTKASHARLPGIVADRAFASLMLDFDGDGDLDIYASKSAYVCDFGAQNRLYLNDGTGWFVDATRLLPVSMDHTNYLAAGDVDRDGDLDIISASFYEPQLYLNCTRQIWAPEIAYDTRQWTLNVTSRPFGAMKNFWTVTLLGTEGPLVQIPGIGGEFGLGSPIILGVLQTHPFDTVSLTLPAGLLLTMKGKKFYSQALVEYESGWHFTGVLEEIVR